MGDCLWAGKPSRYVTSHLGQLSLPSYGVGKSSSSLTARQGLRWGVSRVSGCRKHCVIPYGK